MKYRGNGTYPIRKELEQWCINSELKFQKRILSGEVDHELGEDVYVWNSTLGILFYNDENDIRHIPVKPDDVPYSESEMIVASELYDNYLCYRRSLVS